MSTIVLDPVKLRQMKPSDPLKIDYSSGQVIEMSLQELIRRNFMKEYNGTSASHDNVTFTLCENSMESHLSSLDFQALFKMSYEDFMKMPKWKQVNAKKRYMLF